MIVGVVRETLAGERRVAIVPKTVPLLKKAGMDVAIEPGAGLAAGFPDADYTAAGAELLPRDDVFTKAEIIAAVRVFATPDGQGLAACTGKVLVGLADPLTKSPTIPLLAERQALLFALELLPRITRAQTMDVLSSQATVAGYKAVLLAAGALSKMMPMLTTAAGTLAPAKVLVLGAGVAGLQAIATARRLGAVVSGYDVRPAAREQIASLGAKPVVLALENAEGQGGYAKQMDEAYYAEQRKQLGAVIKDQDIVITTAAIPGARSPILITADAVRAMAPGSVIVDLAAERGGNCELTRAGETVTEHSVQIMGPLNLASEVPNHASQMYSKNIAAFLGAIVKKGALTIDTTDEVVRETLVTQAGRIINERVAKVQA
ncbi:MAG TPA: NAD(P) transhydrogenase subunit alpha [Phycisphaerales bacterium]|nr:NAD(P) transhydrogenase subunit alpha [Phycisphaerales bacterium]